MCVGWFEVLYVFLLEQLVEYDFWFDFEQFFCGQCVVECVYVFLCVDIGFGVVWYDVVVVRQFLQQYVDCVVVIGCELQLCVELF